MMAVKAFLLKNVPNIVKFLCYKIQLPQFIQFQFYFVLTTWSNFWKCKATKANDGKKSIFTEKGPKCGLVFML